MTNRRAPRLWWPRWITFKLYICRDEAALRYPEGMLRPLYLCVTTAAR